MAETLDLSEVFDRDTVKLPGGAVYEIKNPEEFGILGDHQLDALVKRIEAANAKASTDTATEEDARQARDLLRELATQLLIDLPADAEVGEWACVAIFDFHMKKRLARARKLAEEAGVKLPPQMRAKNQRTSARSSRASKRSTAATRKRGS